jgi:hypothetical protein
MDTSNNEGKDGVKPDPEEKVERLEQKTVAIRENIGELITELDHRRDRFGHLLGKPVAIAAGVVGLGGVAALLWWRHRRNSRLAERVRSLLERMTPRRPPAEGAPQSIARRVIGAAAAAAASVAARRLLALALPDRSPGAPAPKAG